MPAKTEARFNKRKDTLTCLPHIIAGEIISAVHALD